MDLVNPHSNWSRVKIIDNKEFPLNKVLFLLPNQWALLKRGL